jgi:hypothetical protein
MMGKPDSTEYAPYYGKYTMLVPEEDILSVMESQLEETGKFLRGISEETSLLKHPPYTWSFKEVLGHLIDCERIFGYRALCIARGDTTPLPGFEENDYAREGQFDRYPFAELVAEFEALRRSHLMLFRHLTPEAWLRRGTANNTPVSVRAIAYILVGHIRHHDGIMQKRLSMTPAPK